MRAELETEFDVVKKGVQWKASLVADFFDVQTSLREYTREINAFEAHPVHRERQTLLKKATRTILARSFTTEEIEAAHIPWEEDWKINIVDHHNVLNHPILLSTNIIANLWQLPSDTPKGIVVFSDSGVPLNNAFHKRGMKFHGRQLNIFPSRERHVISYAAPKYATFPLVKAAEAQDMTPEEIAIVTRAQTLLETAGSHPLCTRFTEQISRINYTLWKELFHPELRARTPELFYITNEDLCHELLKTYLQDPSHLFSRILFDRTVRDVILRSFEGVIGCWQNGTDIGTAFFWGLSETHEKIQLRVQDGALVSCDANVPFRVELNASAILAALEERRLYPGMFLVYGASIFHCGVRPLVGFGSMNYQTKMKEAWIRAMQEIDPAEIPLLEGINTRGFIGGPVATFGYSEVQGFQQLYTLDILAEGGITKAYLEQLASVPFCSLLKPALLDIYDIYLKPEDKQPLTLTHADLMADGFSWLKTLQA